MQANNMHCSSNYIKSEESCEARECEKTWKVPGKEPQLLLCGQVKWDQLLDQVKWDQLLGRSH